MATPRYRESEVERPPIDQEWRSLGHQGLFSVTPAGEKEWTIDTGIDVESGVKPGFSMDVLGLDINVGKRSSVEWNFELDRHGYDPDAPADVGFDDLPSVLDANARWASTLRDGDAEISGEVSIHELESGDALVVSTGGSTTSGQIIRVDREGAVTGSVRKRRSSLQKGLRSPTRSGLRFFNRSGWGDP